MGSGNPESADAVIARATNVFVADKLSIQNKNQLDSLKINWIELRSENGWQRFELVLKNLGIVYTPYDGDIDNNIDKIFAEIF